MHDNEVMGNRRSFQDGLYQLPAILMAEPFFLSVRTVTRRPVICIQSHKTNTDYLQAFLREVSPQRFHEHFTCSVWTIGSRQRVWIDQIRTCPMSVILGMHGTRHN